MHSMHAPSLIKITSVAETTQYYINLLDPNISKNKLPSKLNQLSLNWLPCPRVKLSGSVWCTSYLFIIIFAFIRASATLIARIKFCDPFKIIYRQIDIITDNHIICRPTQYDSYYILHCLLSIQWFSCEACGCYFYINLVWTSSLGLMK